MTSKSVALLLADLGVTKSLNRPYVSNDNPYSESQFKTLKYSPAFPKRFGSIQEVTIHERPGGAGSVIPITAITEWRKYALERRRSSGTRLDNQRCHCRVVFR
ncbi:MAG: hypothetical protein K2Z81_00205 [Cyanobacteria bacterium]|nr:hypothetical protein [Cyanobacteriota bacterium]